MARQTKDQKIAYLTSENDLLERRVSEAYRQRDDARRDLAIARHDSKEEARVSGNDAQLHARLAAVLFPGKVAGFDDVAERVCALLATEEATHELCQEVTGVSNNPLPLARQIKEAKSKAYDLRCTQQSYDALPDNYSDWAEWIKDETEFEPADIDRMVELLDLLGLSGINLARVLQSADMAHTLAKVTT